MSTERFKELIKRYHAGSLTQSEWRELSVILSSGLYEDWLAPDMQRTFEAMQSHERWDETVKQEVWNNIIAQSDASGTSYANPPQVTPRRSFPGGWLRYAAIILLALSLVVYYLLSSVKENEPGLVASDTDLQTDIAPGGDKATLRLSDGTVVTLHSMDEGPIALEGNSSIVKLSDGQIVYQASGLPGGEEMMNTMMTPRGGQYRLVLQDGTRVWLNAASSITYPVIFMGDQRRVSVTGEAYFEVARDNHRPFMVDINNNSRVEVLGTHFNINSYQDEGMVRATLLEGSVRVDVAGLEAVVLKPGQQAQLTVSQTPMGAPAMESLKLNVVSNADVDKVMAWKNGFFDFEGADVKMLMRQLSRWYDIEVMYEDDIPEGKFRGKMDRGLTLSQALEILSESEVPYRLEGRRLIITR